MGYTHLSITERSKLEILHRLRWSTRAIGAALERHHSAIAREWKRGSKGNTYRAETAQTAYTERRLTSKSMGHFTRELAKELNEKLLLTWSPEQIAEERRVSGKSFVCFKTIYRWLYGGRLVAGEVKVLRRKGKRRKPLVSGLRKSERENLSGGNWIPSSPVVGRVVPVRPHSSSVRHNVLGYKDPRPYGPFHGGGLRCVASQYPQETFQTATVDRGKEFACYNALKKFHGLDVYFAYPYSSWQRGSNENGNGLLREFFPKGHDFARVTDEELAHALHLINHRPRKVFRLEIC